MWGNHQLGCLQLFCSNKHCLLSNNWEDLTSSRFLQLQINNTLRSNKALQNILIRDSLQEKLVTSMQRTIQLLQGWRKWMEMLKKLGNLRLRKLSKFNNKSSFSSQLSFITISRILLLNQARNLLLRSHILKQGWWEQNKI